MAYLGPDRTKEQRTAHNKLVNKTNIMIGREPSKHYFIRNSKVCCVDEN